MGRRGGGKRRKKESGRRNEVLDVCFFSQSREWPMSGQKRNSFSRTRKFNSVFKALPGLLKRTAKK